MIDANPVFQIGDVFCRCIVTVVRFFLVVPTLGTANFATTTIKKY